jgi:hypothetical protein
MSERSKIVLGEDDFADPAPGSADATMPTPLAPPVAQAVASPPRVGLPAVSRGAPLRVDPHAGGPSTGGPSQADAGSWLRAPGRSLLIAAAVGVLAGWAITQILGLADFTATSKTAADAHVGVWTGVIGAIFGGVLLGFDSAVAGAWEVAGTRFAKAAVPMFGAAFVAGFIGNAVYLQILQGILEEALRGGGVLSDNDIRFYLARALGWALFGIGIGATIGLLNRSRRQAINGAIGGAIGGTAGGIVFQFVSANLEAGNGLSRLLGLAAVGGLIGLATRAVETARREAWLQILAGGMAGKEFILYHDVTRLGASPECEIFLLKDAAVAKFHAEIEDRGTQRILTAAPGAPVLVNQVPVDSRVLRNGDQLQIGNTVIGYSERASASASMAG